MRKSVDFSKGIRGKHSELNIQLLGEAEHQWAVCVSRNSKDLVQFKLYEIEAYSGSDEVRLRNEKGNTDFYPAAWFAKVEVSKKTLGILEQAA